jgi:uncharacterized protein involved in exopolysaccharide biosynthesis
MNGIAMALVVGYLLFLTDPYFESTISILPNYGGKSTPGGITGLAALAGVSLDEGVNTAEIFKDLLTSESVIEPVLHAEYQTKEYSKPVNLFEYFELEPNPTLDTTLQKRKLFLEMYKQILTSCVVFVDRNTKILTLTVTMPEPGLATSVANNLIQSLDTYVRTKRKSNAALQRIYIDKRVSEIKDSLMRTEDELKIFSLKNRQISNSPELLLQQNRLTRQIQIFGTVYTELSRQMEIARIEEIRDAPIVNVREWARVPVKKAGPNRTKAVLLSFLVTITATVLYVLFFDTVWMFFKNKWETEKK